VNPSCLWYSSEFSTAVALVVAVDLFTAGVSVRAVLTVVEFALTTVVSARGKCTAWFDDCSGTDVVVLTVVVDAVVCACMAANDQ
jgi:hypothetical protein